MTDTQYVDQASALAVAHACAERLRTRFGARRVVIFGSVTGDTPWHGRSDIDLGVEGLSAELFWQAWSDLDDLLPPGLAVDLVPLETASPALRTRILREAPLSADPHERLKGLIADELTSLERIAQATAVGLAGLTDQPSQLELRGLASYVHEFYTGIESIFERIAIDSGEGLPAGEYWHVDLLNQMAQAQPGHRPAAIDGPLCARLRDYLRFRHFFRHAYDYTVQWSKLQPLVEDMAGVLADLKSQIETFL
jgi:predicted nucleotidyltransferase